MSSGLASIALPSSWSTPFIHGSEHSKPGEVEVENDAQLHGAPLHAARKAPGSTSRDATS